MKCDRCGCSVEKGDETMHGGQLLCEDCYMDALSPARACDPWAVYTAKSCEVTENSLNALQKSILDVLRETGGVRPDILAEMVSVDFKTLEREIAALRHVEKVRAAMRDGDKVICLW